MKMGYWQYGGFALSVLFLVTSCGIRTGATTDVDFLTGYGMASGTEPIEALREPTFLNKEKVALGNRLFHEKKLSKDGTLACASCHGLDTGGVDNLPRSLGIGKAEGGINAPTVLNAAFNIHQFWDGRAKTLQDQAAGPVANPKEMGAEWDVVAKKIEADPEYQPAFKKLYDGTCTKETITDAISVFEQSLITTNSRFDRFLKGESGALSDLEKQGYRYFKEFGCASCHQGSNVGGNLFATFGVMGDYFKDRGNGTDADLGRYAVTKREEDRNKFKVPSLRNISKTGPYFHDASGDNLPQAITTMAKYQLGRMIDIGEIKAIEAFLLTLNGEVKK
jgi:cytochrome c peroxidase